MSQQITINPNEDALILVDLQVDFCPGGSMGVPDGDKAVATLARIEPRFRVVAATRDYHPINHQSFALAGGSWPVHCVPGTPGAKYHPNLDVSRITLHIVKGCTADADTYNGFDGHPDLAAKLREQGIKRVFLGGLCTEYCDLHTTLGARRAGFAVVVLTDGCRAIDVQPGDGDMALQQMQLAGASLATTDQLAVH